MPAAHQKLATLKQFAALVAVIPISRLGQNGNENPECIFLSLFKMLGCSTLSFKFKANICCTSIYTLGNKDMEEAIRKLLDEVESVADFAEIKLRDINDTNAFGDNALHCVCVWGDLKAAKLLVENGINIEQEGEGGFTPLKVAEDFGHKEIVVYLISKGANTNALNAVFKYDPEANHNHMKNLENEIKNLEQKIGSECDK